jgi:hypothetical protein
MDELRVGRHDAFGQDTGDYLVQHFQQRDWPRVV